MRRSGGWGAPLSFLVATNLLSTLLALGTLRWLPKSELNLTGMLHAMAPGEISAGMLIGSLLLSTLLLPLTITVKSFILHSLLRIGARSTHPFEITFRALCYAAGAASTLWIIPFCATGAVGIVHQPELTEWTLGLALLASETWSLYVILRAMSCAHRTSLLRVFLVIALPALVAFLLFAAILTAFAPAA